MYKSGWIVSNDVPTNVRTWGKWIKDDIENDVILFIPGNPGITDFYKKFLSTVYRLLNIPVWILCHAGNEIPPSSEKLNMPNVECNPDLFNLKGQIKHKEEFILSYIPKSKNIHLIGHSIGAKICVELLKEAELAKRVKQVHLICPTLQNIVDTPNGRLFRSFLRKIAPILISLAWVFTFFPFKVRAFFLYGFMILYSMSFTTEPCCVSGLLKLCAPQTLKNIFHFANDEMAKVKELDHEVYENYYDKIHVYFGQTDRWAPLYQYEQLKKEHPKIKCQLLDSSIRHSFVFTSSEDVAETLASKIKEEIR